MDPTARNDDLNSGIQKGSDTPPDNSQNPIQPGQFVVAQEEPSITAPNLGAFSPLPPKLQATPPPTSSEPQTKPTVSVSAGQSRPPLPPLAETTQHTPTPVTPTENIQVQTPPSPPTASQPDPTPYVSPQQAQATSQMGGPDQPSTIEKFRIVLIAGAAVILIVIIASLVWFFVINKKENESAKIQASAEQIEEPQLPSPRTTGGFGELPPPSPEATESATPTPGIFPTTSPTP